MKGQRAILLGSQTNLVVVMSQAAFHPADAFFERLVNHGDDPGWSQTEPFPLWIYRARRQFPEVPVAECKRILVGNGFAIGQNSNEAQAAPFTLGPDKRTIVFEAAWPSTKVAGFPFGGPLLPMLHGK